MSKIKIREEEPKPLETREAFEETMDKVAKLEIERQKKAAELKQMHQELDDRFGAQLDQITKEIDFALQQAQPFFLEHQADLCFKGQKQGETKLAVFGVRTGMPKFVKKVKTALKTLADEWFAVDALKPYVKTERNINQQAVIDLWRENREAFDAVIPKSVRVVQEDCFWVEPKADDQVK